MFHSWNQAFRIIGFLGRSPNINLAWCWEQWERWFIWPYHVFPITRHPSFMIVTPSFSSLALFSAIRGLAIATLLWMLDWWSSRRTVFVKTGSSRWILSSAVKFTAVVPWFLDTNLFNVQLFPWFDMPSQLWKLLLWIHLIKLSFGYRCFSKMHTNNLSSLKIQQVSHFAVLSYKLLVNTICNALTLTLHSANKQKNNEIYS